MRTNYVLIDYENVQPDALAALEQGHFKVLVFVGANQGKVNYEVADSLQRLGPKASYVKISVKTKKIYACRSRDVGDMPIVKAANSKNPAEKVEFIVANLRQRGTARPRTVKTLTSTISSLFQKALLEDELAALLKMLQKQGYVSVNDTRVSYSLPE